MKQKWQKGFSLVEVLVTISILTFILASLYNIVISQYRTFEAQRNVSETQRDTRASLSLLERDIRMGGFGAPRGNNPVAAFQNGTVSDATAPDSISMNVSVGPLTYLTSNTVELPGADNKIQVNSVTGYRAGDSLNIINNQDNILIGTYVVNTIDTVNNKLSLNADPTPDGIKVGHFVARNFKTIAYSVVLNAGTGRMELIRNDGTVQSVIVDGVSDFQLTYILDNGTEVDAPADLSQVRRVRVDLTAETTREVARLGAQQISRELATIVPIKNWRL